MARPGFIDSGYSFTLKIGGRDLHDFGVFEIAAPQLSMSPVDVPFDVLPSRHVAVASPGAFRPSPFTITGHIAAGSVSELRTNLDTLKQSVGSLRGNNADVVTPLRLETADLTDRYFPVVYIGGFNVLAVGANPTGQEIASFTLPLMRLTPFAIANGATEATPTATGASFEVLSAGTAPSAPLVEIQGASTTPSFYITDMSFYCDFDYDLEMTKIDGSTGNGSSGASTPIDQFEPGEIVNARYIQAGSFTTSFASVIQNPTEGTVFLFVKPAFDTTASDQHLFEYYIDANNTISLHWSTSTNVWRFTKEIGGAAVALDSAASTHAVNDEIVIAFSYGGDAMKVYVDGGAAQSNSTTTGITGSSGTVYLGDQAASARPSCKYNLAAVMPMQLDDDTVRRFMGNPDFIRPYSVNKARSASIDADDRVILNFEKGTATHVDNAALAQTNDLNNWDSNGFPLIRAPKTCFYLPSGESASSIKINYRKRYV